VSRDDDTPNLRSIKISGSAVPWSTQLVAAILFGVNRPRAIPQ